jgi:hypothetical protein
MHKIIYIAINPFRAVVIDATFCQSAKPPLIHAETATVIQYRYDCLAVFSF